MSVAPWTAARSSGGQAIREPGGSGDVAEVPPEPEREEGARQRDHARRQRCQRAGQDQDDRAQRHRRRPSPAVGEPPGRERERVHADHVQRDHERHARERVVVVRHVQRGDDHDHHHHRLRRHQRQHGRHDLRVAQDLEPVARGDAAIPAERARPRPPARARAAPGRSCSAISAAASAEERPRSPRTAPRDPCRPEPRGESRAGADEQRAHDRADRAARHHPSDRARPLRWRVDLGRDVASELQRRVRHAHAEQARAGRAAASAA